MKKYNWIYILLILLCVGGLFGYRTMDRIRTDTEAPQLQLDPQIPEVSVQDSKDALLQGVSARDDRDGDVTASVVVEDVSLLDNGEGLVMVTYAAFDRAGNVTKGQREAKYTDYERPRFTLKAPLLYPTGTVFDVLSNVGATDVLDGEIQHRVKAQSADGTSIGTLGVHQIQFQVTNSLGDTVAQILPVEVYDATAYNARLELKQYLLYLPVGSAFYPASYLKSCTVMGENINLSNGIPRDVSLTTKGEVLTQFPGVYPVEYEVVYTIRHETNPDLDREFVSYSKLIVVVEG